MNNTLNVWSALFWALEGFSYAISIVILPKMCLSFFSEKTSVATLIFLASIFGYFGGSIRLNILREHGQHIACFFPIIKKIILLTALYNYENIFFVVSALFITHVMQTISSKTWIELIRLNHSNPYKQISAIHLTSYIASTLSIYLAKTFADSMNIRLIGIYIILISSIFTASLIPKIYFEYPKFNNKILSKKKTSFLSLNFFQNLSSIEKIFYSIITLAGLGVTISAPAINVSLIKMASDHFVSFFFYKQLGQTLTFLFFTKNNIRNYPNILFPILLYIPVYLCLSFGIYGVLINIAAFLSGVSTTTSQTIWHCSSIIFMQEQETSLKITSRNNSIILLRNLLAISLWLIIARYTNESVAILLSLGLFFVSLILSLRKLRTL